ncbi:hypothetical protein SeLEV6574_g04308 [Synchytrium endobioticum]|nr:hypothetical protein SeLEV6574_g04308 [Synchytrium endobioticum]
MPSILGLDVSSSSSKPSVLHARAYSASSWTNGLVLLFLFMLVLAGLYYYRRRTSQTTRSSFAMNLSPVFASAQDRNFYVSSRDKHANVEYEQLDDSDVYYDTDDHVALMDNQQSMGTSKKSSANRNGSVDGNALELKLNITHSNRSSDLLNKSPSNNSRTTGNVSHNQSSIIKLRSPLSPLKDDQDEDPDSLLEWAERNIPSSPSIRSQ